MVTVTLIVVGFLAGTAAVIALARASTARWERDKRAPVAARPEEAPLRTPRASSALRLPRAATRRSLAALRSWAARLAPRTSLVTLPPKALKAGVTQFRRVLRSVGRIRLLLPRSLGGSRPTGRSPAPRSDGAGTDTAPPRPSRRFRASSAGRRIGVAGGTRGLLRRTVRLPGRRARALLHRHARAVPRTRRTDEDESATAARTPTQHRGPHGGDLPANPLEERTGR